MKRRHYPAKVKVADVHYKVLFVEKIQEEKDLGVDGEEIYGLCDDGQKIIYLKQGMTDAETFGVFLHELLHAAEKEYGFELKHSFIYDCQDAFKQIFKDNFYVFPKK